jgi:hypothetical protein
MPDRRFICHNGSVLGDLVVTVYSGWVTIVSAEFDVYCNVHTRCRYSLLPNNQKQYKR